jgi:hypothetical protein
LLYCSLFFVINEKGTGVMHITKERFAEILRQHGFHGGHITLIWESYEGSRLNEELAANIARLLAPISKEVSFKI